MKGLIDQIWKSSWKVILILILFFGIWYVAYPPIDLWIFPPPTVFITIDTDSYLLQIPEKWYVYEGVLPEIATYSDLTNTSFIEGSVTIYRFNGVALNDEGLSEIACENESIQIHEIVSEDEAYEIDSIKYSYDSEQKRCISNARLKSFEQHIDFVEWQYHTYFSYQVGNDIILFEINSPEEELKQDLKTIIESIEVF